MKASNIYAKYNTTEVNVNGNYYALEKPAKNAAWSNEKAIPIIGQKVNVLVNNFSTGIVVGYFVRDGFNGVQVKLDKRPQWHIIQNGNTHPDVLVFGVEISY